MRDVTYWDNNTIIGRTWAILLISKSGEIAEQGNNILWSQNIVQYIILFNTISLIVKLKIYCLFIYCKKVYNLLIIQYYPVLGKSIAIQLLSKIIVENAESASKERIAELATLMKMQHKYLDCANMYTIINKEIQPLADQNRSVPDINSEIFIYEDMSVRELDNSF